MNKIYVPKKELMIYKPITDVWSTGLWRYYELGVVGMDNDSTPFLDLARHFDLSGLDAVRQEAESVMQTDQFRRWKAWSNCMIPWELNQGHQFAYYVNHIDELCPPDRRRKIRNIESLVDWVLEQGHDPGWSRSVHLRYWFDRQNRQDYKYKNMECIWLKESDLFPLLKSWLVENVLPYFKTVGRIVMFQNWPGRNIMMHRDLWAYTHNNHFINFYLNPSPRKFYIYDEVKEQKHYVDTRAFMFNESDLHGGDAEDESHFTVRVDGIFTDDFIQQARIKNEGWMFTEHHPLVKQIPNLTYYTT